MQGRFTGEVEVVDGGFRVNGKEVKSFSEPDASNYLGELKYRCSVRMYWFLH